LRIFDAETISNARVTLRVFLMLLIWPTISFDPLIQIVPELRLSMPWPDVHRHAFNAQSTGFRRWIARAGKA